MKTRLFEALIWTATVGAALLAWVLWQRGVPVPGAAAAMIAPAMDLPKLPAADTMTRAAKSIVDSDPFRMARRPATTPFGAEPTLASTPAPPPLPPKPALRLRGIIGPPWEAIVDGLPQRSTGTVVRSGDRIGDLQIRRITRDTIRIAGMDTVWTLTLERALR